MEFIFISMLIGIVSWCLFKIVWRLRIKKRYGISILRLKDITSNLDLFWGVVFLVVGLIYSVSFFFSAYAFLLLYSWPIYLSMLSPIYFVKGFSRVEVFEEGIISRDSYWTWDITKSYGLKEDKKTATFMFRLDRKYFNIKKVVVKLEDKSKLESGLKKIYNL